MNQDSRLTEVRFAEAADRAAVRRTMRHRVLHSLRRNTRGLPVGLGTQEVNEARHIEALAATNRLGEASVGETRMRRADAILESLERTRELRTQVARPHGAARRLPGQTCRASVMIEEQRVRREALAGRA